MTLEDRLDRLEASNRRLRMSLFVLIALGAIIALPGLAQPAAKTITTERLEVVDDQGNILASIGALGGGGAISLNHPSGASARLHAQERAGELVIFNSEQQTTINLSASPDGRGTIETFDNAGHRLVGLTGNDDGGVVVVRNKEGDPLLTLSASAHAGRIRMLNPAGAELVSVGATGQGAGLILTFDDAGKRMTSIGALGAGGVVVTTTAEGKSTGMLGAAR